MLTIDMLIQELKQVPPDQLIEVKRFFQSLKLRTKSSVATEEKPVSFAGLFADWDEQEYNEFKDEIENVRNELFNRNTGL